MSIAIRKTLLDDISKVEITLASYKDDTSLDEIVLNSYLETVQSSIIKYEDVQRDIINQQDTESRKQRELEALENVRKRVAALEHRIEDLITRAKHSAKSRHPGSDDVTQLKKWMMDSMKQLEQQHRDDMKQIEKKHQHEIAKLLAVSKDQQPQPQPQPQPRSEPNNDLLQMFRETTERQTALLEKLTESQAHVKSKLPPIKVPTFSGQYTGWRSFKDIFESLVIKDKSTSKAQKLHHLKEALTGDAANVIRHLETADENFDAAWTLLNARFDKKRSIVMDYIKSFYGISAVQTANNSNVRKLVSDAVGVIQALEAMKETSRDPWLIHTLLGKLDHESITLWARECSDTVPTWDEFVKFLYKRCDSLDAYPTTAKSSSSGTTSSRGSSSKASHKSSTSLIVAGDNVCKCCASGSHPLYECPKFLSQTCDERYDFVRQSNLCRQCLVSKHLTNRCNYRRCRTCQGRHNVLLHERFIAAANAAAASSTSASAQQSSLPATNNGAPREATPASGTGSTTSALFAPKPTAPHHPATGSSSTRVVLSSLPCRTTPTSPAVFLATAIVEVLDAHGNMTKCRAVLDSGSQTSLISTGLAELLKVKKRPADVSLTGVGGIQSRINHQTEIIIQSPINSEVFDLVCMIVPRVTRDLPGWSVNPNDVVIPYGCTLADPHWFESRPVDLLIGGSHYWDIVKDNTIRLGNGKPVLKETSFGFVVVGQLSASPQAEFVCNVSSLSSLDKTLRQFWEIEELPEEPSASEEQVAAEEHFERTHARAPDGRFIVQLPFRNNFQELGDSRSAALRQFMALEKKFQAKPELRSLYFDVMADYIDRGWIEAVPPDSIHDYAYYMAHHGVLKEESTTTKLRVVYNASGKTTSGLSLNDTQMVGPVVQPDLYSILIRFRRHPYAVTTDISKMYPQLMLYHPHSDFQRLLWRNTPEEPITDYRMTRVCFGVASSPFLATKAITVLGSNHAQEFPLACQALLQSFYVDDGLISVETPQQAQRTCLELIDVLAKGGFTLGKWNSNCPHALPDICQSSHEGVDIASSVTKTLGIRWRTSEDIFFFKVSQDLSADTKREMASSIAKIYDPLGLISPIVITAKLLLQELHKLQLGWDESIPSDLKDSWLQFVMSLTHIDAVRVPRWASTVDNPSLVEIHVFSDASLRAYGAAAYLVTSSGSEVSAHLLTSKSRVAPSSNPKTIPCLELCGALTATQLASKLKEILNIDFAFLWTDSTIVLDWLNNKAADCKKFVKHRVNQILQQSSVAQWRHVRTADNPADLITRGATPLQLGESKLWWKGPSWLIAGSEAWPPPYVNSSIASFHITMDMDARSDLQNLVLVHSSLGRCQRVVSYIWRFAKRCRNQPAFSGPISLEEMDAALKFMILLEQSSEFNGLATAIRKGAVGVSAKWKTFASLSPFIDDMGLIRVGGRLQHSQEVFDVKHPILLPRGRLAELIAISEHNRLLHAGPLQLLASLRQRFWPIGGRSLVKRVYRSCVTCTRARPRPESQFMGHLPASRVTYHRPFSFTGVDYAGPIPIRTSQNRNAATRSAYLAIFICMTTRAMHVEVVSSLSTEAFMAALKRFAARRGTPRVIHSDCGRNFIGASRELKDLMSSPEFQRELSSHAEVHQIDWKFNPPLAPHQGGLWEAGVRSVKYHLKRTVGSSPLTFEELTTIISQIEAVLNSRPIGLISDNPNEPEFLTPAHFLVGSTITLPPDPDLTELKQSQLNRWRSCQQRFQHFANRWRRDYLNTLQQRSKWRTPQRNLEIGDVVLTLEMGGFTEKWILGVIEEVHPGIDGRVRVVTVRTPRNKYRRPVTKVARLHPIEESSGPSVANGPARGAMLDI